MRPSVQRLEDLRQAIDLVAAQTGGLDQGEFATRYGDGLSPYAATIGFALIVIGEACAALLKDWGEGAAEIAARHPEIDWKGFIKLRHIVAHQYFRVRPDLVWGVVQDELPALARAVRAELARA